MKTYGARVGCFACRDGECIALIETYCKINPDCPFFKTEMDMRVERRITEKRLAQVCGKKKSRTVTGND